MYKDFFDFRLNPFQLTPDPNFLYLSHELKEILATLEYGIVNRRGFILMVGEPGTGKTTLINALSDKSGANANFAYILNPSLNFNDMLHMVLVDFGLVSANQRPSKTKAIRILKTFVIEQFKKNRNTVIIVDEAQSLEIKTLENLRLLSNLETREHKLIQIIICGQPELENTLSRQSLKQLAQRIGLRCRTKPFDQKDTLEYIDHRLKIAGYNGPQLFANKAKHMIWAYSKGIPRTINIICDNSLLTGYAVNQKRIDSLIVKEVIDDLNKVPLNNIDYPPDESKDTPKGMNQKPIDKSDKIKEVSLKSPKKTDEDRVDVVDKIRRKLIQKKELEPVEKKERRFTAAWIAVIAGVAIIINISIFYLFVGSFKDLKNEFSVKLDSMKDNIQNQLSTIKNEIDKPPPKTYQQTDRNIEGDINNKQERIVSKSDAKPDIDNNSPISGFDTENVGEKNSIVVKRGETLAEIIIRFYGKEDPKILDAVLKKNPEIKNPDLIFENQIIKLPAQP